MVKHLSLIFIASCISIYANADAACVSRIERAVGSPSQAQVSRMTLSQKLTLLNRMVAVCRTCVSSQTCRQAASILQGNPTASGLRQAKDLIINAALSPFDGITPDSERVVPANYVETEPAGSGDIEI